MESSSSRCSVSPEKSMLTRFEQGQHISLGNKIRQSIARLTAHSQIASGQVGTAVSSVEYFYPTAVDAIIILKVALIINQHFIDKQLGRGVLFLTGREPDQQKQGQKYSDFMCFHHHCQVLVTITKEYYRVS